MPCLHGDLAGEAGSDLLLKPEVERKLDSQEGSRGTSVCHSSCIDSCTAEVSIMWTKMDYQSCNRND